MPAFRVGLALSLLLFALPLAHGAFVPALQLSDENEGVWYPNPIGIDGPWCNYPHSHNRQPYFTCGISHAPLLIRINAPAAEKFAGSEAIYMKIDYIRLFKPKGSKAGYSDLTPVYH